MNRINITRLRKYIGNKKMLLPLGVLTIIVISGLYFTQQHEGQNASQRNTAKPVTAIPAGLLSLQEVESITATTSSGDSVSIVGIELGNEDGVLVYKVQLSDGSVKYINALTGTEARTYSHDDDDDTEDTGSSTLPASYTPGISFAAARDVALTKYPDSVIARIKLEAEEGLVVYSVRFSDKSRVDVDAQSGAIVRVKQAKAESADTKKPDERSRSDSSKDSGRQDDSDDNSQSRNRSTEDNSKSDISDDAKEDDSRHRGSDDDDNKSDD